MVKEKRVAFIFKFNDNWIGGTYYIINIIKSMFLLPPSQRPIIDIFYEGSIDSISQIRDIGYPNITYTKIPFLTNYIIRLINYATNKLFKAKWLRMKLSSTKIYNLYPASNQWSFKNVEYPFFWIPDFQEKHLPHFFSTKLIDFRYSDHIQMIKSKNPIVFSSYTALNDFKTFYPEATNKTYVLQFASCINNNFKLLNIDNLKLKYSITFPYFIVSNQFWKHKNHIVVLESVNVLVNRLKISNFRVVFTGKELDMRDQEYISSLKQYIINNGISINILSLGFIERDEQLKLMDNSIAIIQPSLFEGWSTVVEDAKFLNKYIVLSDIPLHREQIHANCDFFPPNSFNELASKMEYLITSKPTIKQLDYESNINKFAKTFFDILK